MAINQTFVDFVTPIPSDWLNNVNTYVNDGTKPIVQNTIAGLKAVSSALHSVVIVLGYYAARDGGGGIYQFDPTDTTSADNGGTIIIGNDATSRWKYVGFTGTIPAQVFGAKWNGTTDDTTAHQNALAWLASIGGGTLLLPLGTSVLSSTLTISTNGVSIKGQGRGDVHDVGNQNVAPTIITWAGTSGTGPMIKITPAPAATQYLSSCSVDEVFLNGAGLASTGLAVWSVRNSVYRISGADCLTNIFETHTFPTLTEASDVQNNDIWISGDQKATTDGQIATFFAESVTGAGPQGNFSFNRVHEIAGDYYGTTSGYNAVDVQGADNNDFYNIQLFRVGGASGNGVRCVQSTGTHAFACQSNNFWHVSPGAGGFYSAGTEAGVLPAFANNIVFYDKNNGPPNPVVGAGSTLWWGSDLAPMGQRIAANGATNQIQFNDGRFRYSGFATVASGGNTVITFPTALSTAVIAAGATPTSANPGYITPTTTNITINNTGAGSATYWWFVEGF